MKHYHSDKSPINPTSIDARAASSMAAELCCDVNLWDGDDFTESFLCIDCGVNTAPGFPSGPLARFYKSRGVRTLRVRVGQDTEIYDLRNSIWRKARMKDFGGCLCIGCLEKRLGRKLRPNDFKPDSVVNELPGTPRLLDRRGQ